VYFRRCLALAGEEHGFEGERHAATFPFQATLPGDQDSGCNGAR
jgi:hypothetical protein